MFAILSIKKRVVEWYPCHRLNLRSINPTSDGDKNKEAFKYITHTDSRALTCLQLVGLRLSPTCANIGWTCLDRFFAKQPINRWWQYELGFVNSLFLYFVTFFFRMIQSQLINNVTTFVDGSTQVVFLSTPLYFVTIFVFKAS